MLSIIKFLAFQYHKVLRTVPNVFTNMFPPGAMPRKNLKIAKSNPFKISATMTSQSVCAKYCGNCPSNPFTHGGLYCISGKSNKEVKEAGCNCFDCDFFEDCGGGSGYFCKYGSAMETNPHYVKEIEKQKKLGKKALPTNSLDSYEERFTEQLAQNQKTISSAERVRIINSIKSNNKTIYLHYEGNNDNRKETITPGETILSVSMKQGIDHMHVCGGKGKCSTCKVVVLDNLENVLPRNEVEARLANIKKFPENVRLGCQSQIIGDITIKRLVTHETELLSAIEEGRFTKAELCEDKHVSVLFADIRSFTSFSEKNLAYDVVHMLNRYFETVGNAIDEHGGYIDKYIGDGIMVIFGLDTTVSGTPEENAVNAALKMLKAVNNFNIFLKNSFNHVFKIGIGVHSGEVVLSNLGYHKKRQFTAIGDVVNTASRVESATKELQTDLLISETTYQAVKDKFEWSGRFPMKLKGKENKLYLYEIVKPKDQNSENQPESNTSSNTPLKEPSKEPLKEPLKETPPPNSNPSSHQRNDISSTDSSSSNEDIKEKKEDIDNKPKENIHTSPKPRTLSSDHLI